ncbi:DUF2169 domain-containing protein [Nannocystaceae bacterium ST9]
MKVVNVSPFHAIVQVADMLAAELPSVVIIKASYDYDDEGRLTISEQIMPLSPDPLETPFGELHGELFFKKQGVDLCVLGSVERAQPITQARLRLRVGDRWAHELLVFGDRHWVPGSQDLQASVPLPFTSMPLGYSHAFGGRVEYNGQVATHPENPVGRGYYTELDQARGQRLPNIELAAGPRVHDWRTPVPVAGWGPYPSFWQLRAAKHVHVDGENYTVQRVDPGVFNHAHPDLVFDELPTGTPILIEGLRDQTIRLRVPPPPVEVEVRVGDQVRMIPAPIDGLFVWTDARKLVVTARARFDYVFQPKQLRQAIVRLPQP